MLHSADECLTPQRNKNVTEEIDYSIEKSFDEQFLESHFENANFRPRVNFTNILQAAFAPILFYQKITN
jgi:hypothetical protein